MSDVMHTPTPRLKLSAAQLQALREVENAPLFRDGTNFWRWFKRLDNGMTHMAARNPTIWVLKDRGLIAVTSNIATITTAGRAALKRAKGE